MAPGGRREGGHGAWVKKAPAGEKTGEEDAPGYKGRGTSSAHSEGADNASLTILANGIAWLKLDGVIQPQSTHHNLKYLRLLVLEFIGGSPISWKGFIKVCTAYWR